MVADQSGLRNNEVDSELDLGELLGALELELEEIHDRLELELEEIHDLLSLPRALSRYRNLRQ